MMSAPTKENALAGAAVDTGGKSTQEQGQIRVWAVPTAGPEVSSSQYCRASYRGIGGLWLTVGEWTLTVETQKSILIIAYHGQRRLVGSSPQGHKEVGMTECACVHTHAHIFLLYFHSLCNWFWIFFSFSLLLLLLTLLLLSPFRLLGTFFLIINHTFYLFDLFLLLIWLSAVLWIFFLLFVLFCFVVLLCFFFNIYKYF